MIGVGFEVPKDSYWSQPTVREKHARRRRNAYAADPKIASAERARARQAYRDKTGAEPINPARDALAGFDVGRTCTATELSSMLGRAPAYVNRLIGRGLMPDPRKRATDHPVFTGAQAKAILEIFAGHIENVASTYRADHCTTRDQLFAVLASPKGGAE